MKTPDNVGSALAVFSKAEIQNVQIHRPKELNEGLEAIVETAGPRIRPKQSRQFP